MSDKSIKPPTTSKKLINLYLDFVGTEARVKFNGDCFKQEKITFNHGKIVNIYILYQIEKNCKYKQLSYNRKWLSNAVN